MKLELRRTSQPEAYDLVLIADEEESVLLDKAFGSRVGVDGLIAQVAGEVRVSDGYREHYIRLNKTEWL